MNTPSNHSSTSLFLYIRCIFLSYSISSLFLSTCFSFSSYFSKPLLLFIFLLLVHWFHSKIPILFSFALSVFLFLILWSYCLSIHLLPLELFPFFWCPLISLLFCRSTISCHPSFHHKFMYYLSKLIIWLRHIMSSSTYSFVDSYFL